ncbi:WAP four-disulfide core domain protein 3-like [Phocoena sinus]|uniref:WAP four-disulfide core domain protein 3-like n=1 Tax=Phocoena sinus TaxID=42100 RepID=UPI0013C4A06F|nr:WAP four-disulfide core domain protein 3-like [Phocoena sinus]
MKTGTIFVLVAFIVTGLEVACTQRPAFGAICVKECSEDRDCERGKECVEIGCVRICAPQTERGYCEIRCWKNWNCGARKWCMRKGCRKVCTLHNGEICVEDCQRDWDCRAGEQCIKKGCSRVCSSVRDPGSKSTQPCPGPQTLHNTETFSAEFFLRVDSCEEECQGPWDCAIGSWCVNNGCGHVCMPLGNPDERRPGTCPQLTPGSSGTCVEMCRGDESCPLGQKCCSNGCGHVCQTAV